MSERDELADLIDKTINDEYAPGDDVMGEDLAPVILAAGYRKSSRIRPDPRVAAGMAQHKQAGGDMSNFEARIVELRADGAKAAMWRTDDIEELLAELRRRDDAMVRVTAMLDQWEAEVPFPDADKSQQWYSLGKRHAAERIRFEMSCDAA